MEQKAPVQRRQFQEQQHERPHQRRSRCTPKFRQQLRPRSAAAIVTGLQQRGAPAMSDTMRFTIGLLGAVTLG